ncbi:S8 family peptidase [Paenibacillus oceani]|uniref:S8 family peptidase n=1 Tax=Paenibacillus oceani TaxID=2772510 RepID=A0A927C8X8_9BACL|nr:S8 family peptidase [Paenibacillus oceani]MBD2861906.1 S8 family peptidase [Paenibacillus oceani]
MEKPQGTHRKRSDIHPKMSPLLRKAVSGMIRRNEGRSASGKLRVIIEFDRKPSLRMVDSLRRSVVTHAHRFEPLRRMSRVYALSAIVSVACLRRLCRHPNVLRIHLDSKLKISLNVATPSVGATALQRRGIGGKGIAIAIIDTGAYPHPDLTRPVNRIVAFKDFVGLRTRTYDDNGHGTHVAGDAAGNGFSSRGKYRGAADQAKLVILKAFDKFGDANSSDVIAAVDWVLRHRKKYNIRVVNMSFGSPGVTRCSDDPICRAAERAWRAGLVVVTAGGNSGPDPRTIESPGISPLLLTVGAVNDRRTIRQADDTVALFSSRGPAAGNRIKPDLTAPGVNIISLRAPGSTLDRNNPSARVGNLYFRLSGSSMSTPIVSGGAAQLLQRYPALKPEGVKRLLKAGAFKLRKSPNAVGSGVLNVGFIAKPLLPVVRSRGKI